MRQIYAGGADHPVRLVDKKSLLIAWFLSSEPKARLRDAPGPLFAMTLVCDPPRSMSDRPMGQNLGDKKMKKLVLIALSLLLTGWATPPPSHAQMPNDHLKCYKIKDGHKGERFRAVADLLTNEAQLMYPHESSCSIVVNSLEFCLPISKDRRFNPDDPRDAHTSMWSARAWTQ